MIYQSYYTLQLESSILWFRTRFRFLLPVIPNLDSLFSIPMIPTFHILWFPDSRMDSLFYLNNSVMSPRIKNMSPEFMLVITEIKNRNGVGNHKIYNFKCINLTSYYRYWCCESLTNIFCIGLCSLKTKKVILSQKQMLLNSWKNQTKSFLNLNFY